MLYTVCAYVYVSTYVCIVYTDLMVDSSLLYCIIVYTMRSRGVSLNDAEREFWEVNSAYSVIFTKNQLSRFSGINYNSISVKTIFDWIWREVGIQPGEYLVKRHHHTYKYNPEIELRFSREAFAYWKLQGYPVDRL